MAVMRTLSAQQLLLQEEAKWSTWSQYSYEYATVTVIDGCFSLEFSLKEMIMTTLVIKDYIGESKINSAKKLPPVGIEHGTS